MTSHASTTYDVVPYQSDPFPHTHPSHLGAIGTVFGMTPPDVGACRVLELGCASGGNIIPMGVELPGGEFLGIDLSQRQIADGTRIVKEVGLQNVELRHASITDIDETWGKFDYIICHGVYSWVPANVQEKIMVVCKENLSENGIAYVSYNTYPGWSFRGVVRDMMRYHVEQFESPEQRIRQARGLLDFLMKATHTHSEAYKKVLAEEASIVSRHADSYLYHEHLEEVNAPCYFHEFAGRAGEVGLQYLGEAEFATMLAANFNQEAFEALKTAPLLRQEQYMDFLRNRTFRRTLLCHAEVPLVRGIPCDVLSLLYLSVPTKLETDGDEIIDDQPVKFTGLGGTLTVRWAVTKAALFFLNDICPEAVSCDTLLAHALESTAIDPDEDGGERDRAWFLKRLTADLMTMYGGNLVQAHLRKPEFTTRPGYRPVANPLARAQARFTERVTNFRHERVVLEGFGRHIISRLDGRHDRPALVRSLRDAISAGRLKVQRVEKPLASLSGPALKDVVDRTMSQLASQALISE